MKPITIQTTVHAPIDHVWKVWNEPEHIMQWLFASDDWECPHSENDLREGGIFKHRMQAKDGSFGFDMGGTYTKVVPFKETAYTFGDRTAQVTFEDRGDRVIITETFDPETQNPEETQRAGWQAILDNFKKHAETVQ